MGGNKVKRKRYIVLVLLAVALCLTGCAENRTRSSAVKTQETGLARENGRMALLVEEEAPSQPPLVECEAVPEEEKSRYLSEHGFSGEEPYRRYYDNSGGLQLDFYYDERQERGTGFRSGFTENGFSFKGYTLDTWQEPELIDVGAGSDSVENYREFYDYNEAGQLLHYRSEGDINWLKDNPGHYTVISVDFDYRENGILRSKETIRNPWIFGSTDQWSRSWYDEARRLAYQEAYITHGSNEIYYFYEGDSRQPAYSLQLDSAGEDPHFVKYEG